MGNHQVLLWTGEVICERFFHQILLFFCQVCGYLDYNFHREITPVIGIQVRHTLLAERKGYGSGYPGDFQEGSSGDCRYVDLSSSSATGKLTTVDVRRSGPCRSKVGCFFT